MLVLPVPGGPHRIIDDELAGRDHPADRAVGPGQMLLADDLVEARRAQPVGERRVGAGSSRRGGRAVFVGEQVGHRAADIRRAAKNCTAALVDDASRYILDTS